MRLDHDHRPAVRYYLATGRAPVDTLTALADELGVRLPALSEWLAGRRGSLVLTLPLVAAALGTTPEALGALDVWAEDDAEAYSERVRLAAVRALDDAAALLRHGAIVCYVCHAPVAASEALRVESGDRQRWACPACADVQRHGAHASGAGS